MTSPPGEVKRRKFYPNCCAPLIVVLRDESGGPVSICRKPDRSLPDEAQTHTVASVIMELARGVMHVAPDEPSRVDYQPMALATEAMPA